MSGLNAEAYLPELFASLDRQTLPPAEIILVDSSSSDHTAKIVRARKGPIPIVHKKVDFAYPGRARNIGVQVAHGAWIAFIDCRTIPRPEWLEMCMEAARRSSGHWVGGLCVSESATSFGRMLQAVTYGHKPWVTLPGSLVSKDAFERIGGFEPDVRAGEDLEWMERASTQERTATVPEPTIRYSGFPRTLGQAVKKWHRYALANATIEVRNNQKNLYLAIFIMVILFMAYRWNATFAPSEQDVFYLPNVTKISAACVALVYMAYRGIFRPAAVDVATSYVLPWRWIALGFIAICLDLAKAPGLIWGSLLLLKRRIWSLVVRWKGLAPWFGRSK